MLVTNIIILIILFITLIVLGFIVYFLLQLQDSWLGNKLGLHFNASKKEGFVGTIDKENLIGVEGITLTPLRPTGRAKIKDAVYNVTSDNIFLEKDCKIKVTKIIGNHIYVEIITS